MVIRAEKKPYLALIFPFSPSIGPLGLPPSLAFALLIARGFEMVRVLVYEEGLFFRAALFFLRN
ncbi:MAG TPA: hypothetical protein DCQ34_06975 [Chitinophagaceae bacterium]|nr:hypothetical protein [Chitinophagaceae bacterium]HCY89337.1 hypothetical protein [Chitinophagaceae bacterium]